MFYFLKFELVQVTCWLGGNYLSIYINDNKVYYYQDQITGENLTESLLTSHI